MRFAKKVVIAVGMKGDVIKNLSPVKELSFLGHSEIYFVHVFNTINTTNFIGDFPMIYPLEADRKSIEESVTALISKMAADILPSHLESRVHFVCLFDDSPRARFATFVEEIHADLVVIPTREKHGFFTSSFADYVNSHCKSSMLLLKFPTGNLK